MAIKILPSVTETTLSLMCFLKVYLPFRWHKLTLEIVEFHRQIYLAVNQNNTSLFRDMGVIAFSLHPQHSFSFCSPFQFSLRCIVEGMFNRYLVAAQVKALVAQCPSQSTAIIYFVAEKRTLALPSLQDCQVVASAITDERYKAWQL